MCRREGSRASPRHDDRLGKSSFRGRNPLGPGLTLPIGEDSMIETDEVRNQRVSQGRPLCWSPLMAALVGPGLLGLLACTGDGRSMQRTVLDANASPPAEWILDREPALVLARPGSDGVEEFADVVGVVRLDDGSFVVGAGDTDQLYRFDTQGRFLLAFGRTGSGPGEFGNLWELWAWADTVVAFDGRGVGQVFSSDGTYLRSLPRTSAQRGGSLQRGGVLANGLIVEYVVASPRGIPAGESIVPMTVQLRASHDGSEAPATVGTYPAAEITRETGGPTAVRYGAVGHIATLAHGYCTGFSTDYVVRCHDPSGHLLSEVVREGWKPAPVTAVDRNVFFQGIDRANPGPRGEAYRKFVRETTVFARVLPPYGRFVGSVADELWVGPMNPAEFTLGERNPVSEEPARWSVYSLEGRWLAEVELPARFRLLAAGREYVAGVTRTDQGTERVEVYQLGRTGGG